MKQSNNEIRNRYLKKQKAYKRKKRIKRLCFLLFVLIVSFLIYLFIKNKVNIKNDNVIDVQDDLIIIEELTIEEEIELEKENDEKYEEVEEEVSNNISDEEFEKLKKMFENCDDISSWNLLLVNKNNYIPDDFNVKLQNISNGHSVDERIVDQLNNMLNDAKANGVSPYICASYRSNNTQTMLYNNKVSQYKSYGYEEDEAKQKASEWVAIPGTSEHQLGLALDIVDSSYTKLNQNQEDTKVQKWLMENSYKYGFILRYPNDKKDITMINYEPWHYRYVGVNNAKVIYENNLTLEEFIEKYKSYIDSLYN